MWCWDKLQALDRRPPRSAKCDRQNGPFIWLWIIYPQEPDGTIDRNCNLQIENHGHTLLSSGASSPKHHCMSCEAYRLQSIVWSLEKEQKGSVIGFRIATPMRPTNTYSHQGPPNNAAQRPASSQFESFPRADHFPVSASFPGGVISIENPHLLPTIVACTESVTSLLPHSLHLPHLSNSFLKLLHSWPIVLHVIFLNFLHVMICLGIVHSFGIFPGEVANET